MDLSTPLGIDCPITADDSAQFPMVLLASFCLSVKRSTCSFKLICSSPGFAVLNQSRPRTFPQFIPGPVPASTARHPVGVCQTAVLRKPFTIFRTRVRSTLRPRLEATAFDAVASTRTRGFYHLCHFSSHGHRAQSSRCTLGQRVKLSFA